MAYFLVKHFKFPSSLCRRFEHKSSWMQEFRRCLIDDTVVGAVAYYHPNPMADDPVGGKPVDPTLVRSIMRKNPTDKAWFDYR